MKIFFSHSSRDKPLIREIRSYLPHHVKAWIDEREIPVGEHFGRYIKNTITSSTDFVVIFIGPEAVRSEWVGRELEWALEHERALGRLFVLPVLLDKESWGQMPEEFQDRRYLPCLDFTEMGVRDFARRLADELFAQVSASPVAAGIPNFELEREDVRKRQEKVKEIAARIADNQQDVTDEGKLTKGKLILIISSLEPIRKVELLCLYELLLGRFKQVSLNLAIESASRLRVEMILSGGKSWTNVFEWSVNPFMELRQLYGLGDDRHIVRDVFLQGIKELSQEEKHLLFSDIIITNCSFER